MSDLKAHAYPTKEFFVTMITKDISLEDSILDLLDNCLDGARRVLIASNAGDATIDSYAGFGAELEFDANHFLLRDNCGGIRLADAIDYAFHFGRRPDAPNEKASIGVYGIGMKRAVFKLGALTKIHSSTSDQSEAFLATIDVPDWLNRPDRADWDFDLDYAPPLQSPGTEILVEKLYLETASQFEIDAFKNELVRIIARDYSEFLAKGFSIAVNHSKVAGYRYLLKSSDDFKPVKIEYQDDGVRVEITAGMAGVPPDDLNPSARKIETDYYGWFVLCNNRVVVAADTTPDTVWGDVDFPAWHYQYNGFMGRVSFHSNDPTKLPWRTTKRSVDVNSPIYRRAVAKMKDITRTWIDYTNLRKANIDEALKAETSAPSKPINELQLNATLEIPRPPAVPAGMRMTRITYDKTVSEVGRAKRILNNEHMSNKLLGIRTFDYFMENEAPEEIEEE